MKNIRFHTFVLTITTLLLSACGAATASPAAPEATASAKVIAMPVAFVGIVDSITGDQWVISGTTVTVDPAIVRNGPFNVGDRVKVEGFAHSDGSLTLSRVEAPTPQETATLSSSADDNSNDANVNDDNSNDGNINDDNSNTANSNDDHGGSVNTNDDTNVNDDNGNDANTNEDHGGNSNGSGDNSGSGGSNSNDDKGGDNGNGGKDDNGNGG